MVETVDAIQMLTVVTPKVLSSVFVILDTIVILVLDVVKKRTRVQMVRNATRMPSAYLVTVVNIVAVARLVMLVVVKSVVRTPIWIVGPITICRVLTKSVAE